VSLLDALIVLPWVLVACGGWLGYVLIRQSDRMIERLEQMEQQFDTLHDEVEEMMPREALPAGAEAPAFELPDLTGQPVALEQFRGRRVLLIFFSPTCPFCQQMAPELAKLPYDGSGGLPVPVVIAVGDPEANRALVDEHMIRCPFLLDEAKDVVDEYYPEGTPAAYLIDEQGLIARERADGVPTIMALARTPAPSVRQPAESGAVSGRGGAGIGAGVAVSADPRAEQAGGMHEVHIPIASIPQEGIGVGDLVKRMTDKLGIKPCRGGGCERRRVALNRWVIRGPRREGRGREGRP